MLNSLHNRSKRARTRIDGADNLGHWHGVTEAGVVEQPSRSRQEETEQSQRCPLKTDEEEIGRDNPPCSRSAGTGKSPPS